MNNTNQNPTDNFFRQGLSSPPEFVPSDKNWKEMERLLQPEAKRRPVAWIYSVSGIAAALLIFLSLWFVSDESATETQPVKVARGVAKNAEDGNTARSNLNLEKAGDNKDQTARLSTNDRTANNQGALSLKIAQPTIDYQLPATNNQLPITDHRLTVSSYQLPISGYQLRIPDHELEVTNARLPLTVYRLPETETEPETEPHVREANKTGKWALGLALSPDVNSVKGMHNGKLGASMGMGLSYKLGKALSIGTGVYYSQKAYSADKTSYKATEKPFATWTSYAKKITADCRVIDVPLNLSLRLSDETQTKLHATAGLSSYIMLSEKYDFSYNVSPMYPTGHRVYNLRNQNKHLLSVVNLGIAIEKPLADQVSLVIQPYAKLPLSGIGQGETDLKSVGVGFRLNYSLKRKN